MPTLISSSSESPFLELSPSQKSLVKAWWRKANSNMKTERGNQYEKQGVVFGIPLTDSLRYAHSRISYLDERAHSHCNAIIPTIVAKCGAFLKEKALYTEGIFRLSGNAKRISMLQAIFDAPSEDYGLHLNWQDYTVHDASNVMRRFLNHLPQPLISLHYQALFKTTLDAEFPSLESKIDAFQNLIERLPIAHQYLLLYLLDLLYLFSQCAEYTRMESSSLATAFSPVIFSDPAHATNPAGYKESQRALEFLILHQNKFLMPNSLQNDVDKISAYPG
ncbi:Rho GTPase activation protein [Parasitella parasitica]|nr:Rho GTPase activation protein [Parasitella parasitica]